MTASELPDIWAMGRAAWPAVQPYVGHIILALATLYASGKLGAFNRSKQRDELNAQYAAMHDEFWKDPALGEVRKMMLVDKVYDRVRPVLARRFQAHSEMTEEDYDTLDKIDKYVNFVIRVDAVKRRYLRELGRAGSTERFVEDMLFEYWLRQIVVRNRVELFAYVAIFYYMLPKSRDRGQDDREARRAMELVRMQLKLADRDRDLTDSGRAFGAYALEVLQGRSLISERHYHLLNDLVPGAHGKVALPAPRCASG
ncbi:hypothetical protein [Mangrovicoccus ximenensis]|uniref:hypothetical protein n=1 Tax=Mangrovicoccus ximenensis TaxID=1911570 RepID=UPI000D35FBE4|nr:hypothetical protein [Mangrovicoccus ximenensis]